MALHPCSFIEFLQAIGEGRFVDWILEARLPEAFHQQLMLLFNSYALIGGMPEIVAEVCCQPRCCILVRYLQSTAKCLQE